MKTWSLKTGMKVRFEHTSSAFMDMLVVKADDKEVIVHRPYIYLEDNEPVVGVEKLAPFNRESSMEWDVRP